MSPPPWLAPAVTRLRTANPYVVDAALAALVLFAASLQWIFPDEGDDRLTWQGWLLAAATAVPLVWRRRAPFATACAVSMATPAMALYHAPPPDVVYGGLVVLYTMAAQGRVWQHRFMLGGWILGVVLTMQHKEEPLPFEYAFQLLSVVGAYGFGMLSRVQRAYTAALVDRARRLEREGAADTARATAQGSRCLGVRVGSATTSAPASDGFRVVAVESSTWNATRMCPATRRPTSASSMNAAWFGSVSSRVARPASRMVTRPPGEENAARSGRPGTSR